MIIDKIDKTSLKEYLILCSTFVDIDVDYFYDVTISYINQHDKKSYDIEKFNHIQNMLNIWNSSLEKNEPDYSVYLDPYYFCEVLLCWVRYSRRTIKEMQSKKSLFGKSIIDDMTDIDCVIDLGCGFGYTTAALKEIYPNATVIGTNIENSLQYKIAEKISTQNNFKMKSNFVDMKADLIFASEYFEHFERPVEHLIDVITKTNPKYLIVANSFGPMAIGHFNIYKHLNLTLTPKQTSKLFTKTLNDFGYTKMKTNCWNSRPTYFRKK